MNMGSWGLRITQPILTLWWTMTVRVWVLWVVASLALFPTVPIHIPHNSAKLQLWFFNTFLCWQCYPLLGKPSLLWAVPISPSASKSYGSYHLLLYICAPKFYKTVLFFRSGTLPNLLLQLYKITAGNLGWKPAYLLFWFFFFERGIYDSRHFKWIFY